MRKIRYLIALGATTGFLGITSLAGATPLTPSLTYCSDCSGNTNISGVSVPNAAIAIDTIDNAAGETNAQIATQLEGDGYSSSIVSFVQALTGANNNSSSPYFTANNPANGAPAELTSAEYNTISSGIQTANPGYSSTQLEAAMNRLDSYQAGQRLRFQQYQEATTPEENPYGQIQAPNPTGDPTIEAENEVATTEAETLQDNTGEGVLSAATDSSGEGLVTAIENGAGEGASEGGITGVLFGADISLGVYDYNLIFGGGSSNSTALGNPAVFISPIWYPIVTGGSITANNGCWIEGSGSSWGWQIGYSSGTVYTTEAGAIAACQAVIPSTSTSACTNTGYQNNCINTTVQGGIGFLMGTSIVQNPFNSNTAWPQASPPVFSMPSDTWGCSVYNGCNGVPYISLSSTYNHAYNYPFAVPGETGSPICFATNGVNTGCPYSVNPLSLSHTVYETSQLWSLNTAPYSTYYPGGGGSNTTWDQYTAFSNSFSCSVYGDITNNGYCYGPYSTGVIQWFGSQTIGQSKGQHPGYHHFIVPPPSSLTCTANNSNSGCDGNTIGPTSPLANNPNAQKVIECVITGGVAAGGTCASQGNPLIPNTSSTLTVPPVQSGETEPNYLNDLTTAGFPSTQVTLDPLNNTDENPNKGPLAVTLVEPAPGSKVSTGTNVTVTYNPNDQTLPGGSLNPSPAPGQPGEPSNPGDPELCVQTGVGGSGTDTNTGGVCSPQPCDPWSGNLCSPHLPNVATPCTNFPFGVICWPLQLFNSFSSSNTAAPSFSGSLPTGISGFGPFNVSFNFSAANPIITWVRPLLGIIFIIGIVWLFASHAMSGGASTGGEGDSEGSS